MSAISKIGASPSLLIATIVPASLMPVRCWIAPQMPIGDVQLRRDDLAGLADLQLVRHVAGVDRRARGADRGAELVGELVDDLEVLGRADAAAAGDHARGALQVGAVGLAGGEADEARVRRQRRRRRSTASTGGVAAARGFRPRRGAHGGDHGVVGRRLDGDDRVAGVDRALERVAAFDRHHVGHLRHAEQRGDARHQVLAEGGATGRTRACSRRRAWRPAAPAPARARCALAALATVSTLRDAGDLRGFGGDGGRVGGQHDDVDRRRASAPARRTRTWRWTALSLPSRCSATIRTLLITAAPLPSVRRPVRPRPSPSRPCCAWPAARSAWS